MKILYYVLATGAGLIGTLGMLRGLELLLVGQGVQPTQVVFGVIGILLAVIWVKRARAINS